MAWYVGECAYDGVWKIKFSCRPTRITLVPPKIFVGAIYEPCVHITITNVLSHLGVGWRRRWSGSLRQYLQIYSGGGYEQAVVAHELELCVSESNLWMWNIQLASFPPGLYHVRWGVIYVFWKNRLYFKIYILWHNLFYKNTLKKNSIECRKPPHFCHPPFLFPCDK